MTTRKGLWLPDEILALTDLSLAERMVLGQVCYRAAKNDGVCSDSNAEIAACIHIHPMTVSNLLNKLIRYELLQLAGGQTRAYEPRARLVSLYIRAEAADQSTPTTSVMVTQTGTTQAAPVNGLGSVNGLRSAVDLPLVNGLGGVSQRLRWGKSTAYDSSVNDLPLHIGIKKIKTVSKLSKKGGAKKNHEKAVVPDTFSPKATATEGQQECPPVARPPQTVSDNTPLIDPVPAVQPPVAVPLPVPAAARPAPATRPKAAPHGQLGLPLARATRPGDPFLRQSQAETCNVAFSTWFAAYGNNTGEVSCKTLWLELTDQERVKAMEHTPLYLAAQSMHKLPYNYLFDKHFNSKIINRHAANSETRSDQPDECAAVLPRKQYEKQSFRRS